jgi:hypothetical protein
VVGPRDPSVCTYGCGIEQITIRVDESHDRCAPSGCRGHLLERLATGPDEAGFEQQVFGRIAGDGQLREHRDVASESFGALIRVEDPGGVAIEITDDGVELAERHADSRHVSQRTEYSLRARLAS